MGNNKFKAGRVYLKKMNDNLALQYTVCSITQSRKSLVLEGEGEKPFRKKIYITNDGLEYIKPLGDYAGCPHLWADRYDGAPAIQMLPNKPLGKGKFREGLLKDVSVKHIEPTELLKLGKFTKPKKQTFNEFFRSFTDDAFRRKFAADMRGANQQDKDNFIQLSDGEKIEAFEVAYRLDQQPVKKTPVLKIVKKLKDQDQDFEWYPTTPEILKSIRHHAVDTLKLDKIDVLDLGAGDGRGAKIISNGGKKMVVEKSTILQNQMPVGYIPVGTDFFQTNLVCLETDVIFSNPPYKQFSQWAEKIILEANCKIIYLVIPERWESDEKIKQALETRGATTKSLGKFDFANAERKARAKVDILAIDLCKYHAKNEYSTQGTPRTDPFILWFDQNFKLSAPVRISDRWENLGDKAEKELVNGINRIEVLVKLYNKDIQTLRDDYTAICGLSETALGVIGRDRWDIVNGLKENLKGLKNKYWKELFNTYTPITSRLTSNSRQKMIDKLQNATNTNNKGSRQDRRGAFLQIDFTLENAHAITVWAIKNASSYMETQIIEVYEQMINKGNIDLYKSNKRTFSNEDWRYTRKPEDLDKYALKLDYRLVLTHCGEIQGEAGFNHDYKNGLSHRGANLVNDIKTIAYNLGFSVGPDNAESYEWGAGQKNQLTLTNGEKLLEAKGHLNGNMHIKINVDVLRAWTVEFSRLKGWIKDKTEMVKEVPGITLDQAEKAWSSNYKLVPEKTLLQIAAAA